MASGGAGGGALARRSRTSLICSDLSEGYVVSFSSLASWQGWIGQLGARHNRSMKMPLYNCSDPPEAVAYAIRVSRAS